MSEKHVNYMPTGPLATNTVSQGVIDASRNASAAAMDSWLKNKSIPVDYLRKQLGDPGQVIIVQPAGTPPQQP